MAPKPSPQQASSTAAWSFSSASLMPDMSMQTGPDRSIRTLVRWAKVSPSHLRTEPAPTARRGLRRRGSGPRRPGPGSPAQALRAFLEHGHQVGEHGVARGVVLVEDRKGRRQYGRLGVRQGRPRFRPIRAASRLRRRPWASASNSRRALPASRSAAATAAPGSSGLSVPWRGRGSRRGRPWRRPARRSPVSSRQGPRSSTQRPPAPGTSGTPASICRARVCRERGRRVGDEACPGEPVDRVRAHRPSAEDVPAQGDADHGGARADHPRPQATHLHGGGSPLRWRLYERHLATANAGPAPRAGAARRRRARLGLVLGLRRRARLIEAGKALVHRHLVVGRPAPGLTGTPPGWPGAAVPRRNSRGPAHMASRMAWGPAGGPR